MIKAFGLGSTATNYKDALKEVRKWLDEQEGVTTPSIKVEGHKTTVTLPDGRVGVARCNPCDKFDIITGIRIALDDIERKSIKLNDEEKMYLKVAKKAGAKYVVHFHYECSIDDVFFTTEQNEDTENNKLSIEDDELFSWLKSDQYYRIDELLKERG